MSSFPRLMAGAAVVGLLASAPAAAAEFAGIGRAASAREVTAWDIDVRPDFKGLPAGSGSVAKGQEVWEAKCASCHGIFGESNLVFSPIAGGTSKQDLATGRVARLKDPAFPQRTTLMKLSSLSTLWDYINRAMPWNEPKSLTTEEVYATVAYILHLGDVLPADYVLSDRNISAVQAMLPNRNGKTTDHALWPGHEFGGGSRPDAGNVACMKNCAIEPALASYLPDFARNQHGNLAEQNRIVGPQRGALTTAPPTKSLAETAKLAARITVAAPAAAEGGATDVGALAEKKTCTGCHGADRRIVGPAFREIAAKYGQRADAVAYLAGRIKSGGSGVWGEIPMPAQNLSDEEAKLLAQWLMQGGAR
jgi:S-disulfanyl-L-cysteine oxidoreductase SoxD